MKERWRDGGALILKGEARAKEVRREVNNAKDDRKCHRETYDSMIIYTTKSPVSGMGNLPLNCQGSPRDSPNPPKV